MTLDACPVTRATLTPLMGMSVRDDQRDPASSNMKTIAEAPFEPGSGVWGAWDGEVPVDLTAMVDPASVRLHGLHLRPGAADLWRLMIAADQQRQGYGGQALQISSRQRAAGGQATSSLA